MSDTLLLALIPVAPAVIVFTVVILLNFFKKKPSRYYGTFYYKE
jgi:hypothetical protein